MVLFSIFVNQYHTMNRLINFLLHPAFISLIISLLIIWALPPIFNKFEVKLTNSLIALQDGDVRCYHDFNHDGNSEFVMFRFHSTINNKPYFSIKDKDNKIFNDWPISHGQWLIGHINVFFGDFDNNGQDEVYGLSISNDSIFLNGIEPLGSKEFVVREKFITMCGITNNSIDSQIMSGMLCDLNGDSYKEAIISITSGYSIQPRAIFAYDFVNDTIFRSPYSMTSLDYFYCEDLDGDHINELFGITTPRGNTSLSSPYSDSIAWLMVLDNNLDFKFEPIPLNIYPSGIEAISHKIDNKEQLLVLSDYSGTEDIATKLFLYTPKGIKIDSLILQEGRFSLHFYQTNSYNKKFLVKWHQDELIIYEIKDKFKLKNVFQSEDFKIFRREAIDINNDGNPEFIFYKKPNPFSNHEELVITDHNFKNPVTLKLGTGKYSKIIITTAHKKKINLNYISIQQTDRWYKYEYFKNPLYNIKYLIHGGIYLVLYLFFLLLFKLQKHLIEKRHKNEKYLSSLQLKTIKNQLDPHFALNTLNAIGSLISKNDTHLANQLFEKYSKLTRETLLGANKVSNTIKEELSFVRDFLELEKFRYNNKFEYSIIVDESIDPNIIKLPRMLVHTFIENAVKHGLKHIDNKEHGQLNINVSKKSKHIVISIKDNGIGRLESAKYNKFSTGKGIEIVSEMTNLYNKLNNTKITYQIIDLERGTEVIVILPT